MNRTDSVRFPVTLVGGTSVSNRFPCRGGPKGMRFLGHTRSVAYFMIAIFPIQSGYLVWSWPRVCAIAVFAVPLWLVLHLALMPVRK